MHCTYMYIVHYACLHIHVNFVDLSLLYVCKSLSPHYAILLQRSNGREGRGGGSVYSGFYRISTFFIAILFCTVVDISSAELTHT